MKDRKKTRKLLWLLSLLLFVLAPTSALLLIPPDDDDTAVTRNATALKENVATNKQVEEDETKGESLNTTIGTPSTLTEQMVDDGTKEEHADGDDRTLLDIFGQVAKEYLTKHLIPDTDEACHWDWRFARCEPFCSCRLHWKRGDYHLGRACRLLNGDNDNQQQNDDDGDDTTTCSIPPDTPYSRIVGKSIRKGRHVKLKAKERLQMALLFSFHLRHGVCESLSQDCSNDDESLQHVNRNWKQKLLCNHIPNCNGDDDDKTDDFLFNNGGDPAAQDLVKAAMQKDETWSWI